MRPSVAHLTVVWVSCLLMNSEVTGCGAVLEPALSAGQNPIADSPGIIISEVMADNDRTLNDEDGNSSDWIELYNSSGTSISLAGWTLTDDPTNLTKWQFPALSLSPKAYLVIFASGKNRTNLAFRLHTNFKLNSSGEYLALVDPNKNVVSAFSPSLAAMGKDVSYGRDRADPLIVGYFLEPTPGRANSISGLGFAPPIEFSQISGTFVSPFQLVLSTASTSAIIRYTTNSTLPTKQSSVYTNAISISTTTQIRARAFEPSLLPGPPRSETFVALDPDVVNFTSTLPLLILHNLGAGAVPANNQLAYMAIHELGPNGVSSLTNQPTLSTRAGINIRGASSWNAPKSNFAVEWWDEFDADKDLSPLGLPRDSDWVLYGPYRERALIQNPLMYQLSREIGRYAPRTRFVEVYLHTGLINGPIGTNHYNGIYVLAEKIKRGPNRVNIDKLEPEHTKPPEVTGGYIFEVNEPDPNEHGIATILGVIAYAEPKEAEIVLAQSLYARTYFLQISAAVNTGAFTNGATGYGQFIDVDSWIDYHILNVLSANPDALHRSSFFYKPRGGTLTYGPLWDFDDALAASVNASPTVWAYGNLFSYSLWGRLFRDPDFWQQWIDRWQELRRNQFSTSSLHFLVDSLANEVREAQPRDTVRWKIEPRGGSYQAEIDRTKAFLRDRTAWIDSQFPPVPEILTNDFHARPGDTLCLRWSLTRGPADSTNASIYYTLNGTDPRSSGGALSPEAIRYASPIVLQSTAHIMARTRDLYSQYSSVTNAPPLPSPWSGLTTATFVISGQSMNLTAEIRAGFVVLRFAAVAGVNYTAQYRDRLDAGPWLKLADVSPRAVTGPSEAVDTTKSLGNSRFYRIIAP